MTDTAQSMPTKAEFDTYVARQGDNYLTTDVDIDDIRVVKRLRLVKPEKVEELKASIAKLGLLQPILVDESLTLIAGLHRLRACQALGWDSIPATRADLDALGVELAEIDENLIRTPLTQAEQDAQLARRKQIYLQLYPDTAQGKAGANARHGAASDKLSFAEDAAQKLSVSKRTVERSVARGEAISDDVRETIAGTGVDDNQSELEALAKLPVKAQKQVANLVRKGKANSVRELLNVGSVAWSSFEIRIKERLEAGDIKTAFVDEKSYPFLCAWAKDEKLFVDLSKTRFAKIPEGVENRSTYMDQVIGLLPNPSKAIAALSGKVVAGGEKMPHWAKHTLIDLVNGTLQLPAPLLDLGASGPTETTDPDPLASTSKAKPRKDHRSQGTGNEERYTPTKFTEAARQVFGGTIELDVASSELAQQGVRAERFFTKEDDALDKKCKWVAESVWMNPPYSRDKIGAFCNKLMDAIQEGAVSQAIVMVNNGTSETWGQMLLSQAVAVCFPGGRVRFHEPCEEGLRVEPMGGKNMQGTMILYYGHRYHEFCRLFRGFGFTSFIDPE